jgi:hypothetical protein
VVALGGVGRLGMTLREACDGDAKVSGVVLVDETDEIDGVMEPARSGLPGSGASDGVATESEDVLASMCLGLLRNVSRIAGRGDVSDQI